MDLKDAMAISIENDEIWIAAGTYKPTDDGDRNATFELKDGMKLLVVLAVSNLLWKSVTGWPTKPYSAETLAWKEM